MKPNEVTAAGELMATGLGEATSLIEELHGAIAQRSFPAGSLPARLMHDAIAGGVYAGVRGLGMLLLKGGAAAVSLTRPPEAPSVIEHPRMEFLLGTMNGLIGDRLEEKGNPLAVEMSIHHPEGFEGRVAIFVHGLFESARAWTFGGGPTYGDRLLTEFGIRPATLTYNTGLHISENGRRLAQLLENTTAEADEIILIGHSMGGLVARSACHQGHKAGYRWTRKVRRVISLGSPHMGSHVEQAVHAAAVGLDRIPETRPISRVLKTRSVGIKDLRHGAIVEDDWRERDPDAWLPDGCTDIPLLDGATHCFITSSISPAALGRYVGDLLVLEASGSGKGKTRTIPFDAEFGKHLPGVNHFQLLNHPHVYEQLRAWLAPPPQMLPEPRRRPLLEAGRRWRARRRDG